MRFLVLKRLRSASEDDQFVIHQSGYFTQGHAEAAARRFTLTHPLWKFVVAPVTEAKRAAGSGEPGIGCDVNKGE